MIEQAAAVWDTVEVLEASAELRTSMAAEGTAACKVSVGGVVLIVAVTLLAANVLVIGGAVTGTAAAAVHTAAFVWNAGKMATQISPTVSDTLTSGYQTAFCSSVKKTFDEASSWRYIPPEQASIWRSTKR